MPQVEIVICLEPIPKPRSWFTVAKQLSKLLHGMNAYINLIPYNAVDEKGFKSVSHDEAMVFYDLLMKNHVRCTIRKEHGNDIDAACGQLRIKEIKKEGI